MHASHWGRVGSGGSEDERLIREALAHPRAQRALIARLDPLVRAPVRIVLRRWPGQLIAGMDQDDLISEIFEQLFADDGRDLLRYSTERGTLKNYVSLYARSRLRDLEKKELRRIQLFPPPESLNEDALDAVGGSHAAPDEVVIAVQQATKLRSCMNKKLTTDKAQQMLRLLYDQGLSTDEIQDLGFDRPAVFRWRSAILAAARECFALLERENSGSPRKS